MNIWQKITHLGVKDNMPIYKQKSTIFFNVYMRIGVFALIGISLVMFIFTDFIYTPIGILFGIPVAAIALFLNKISRVELSIIITSIFYPIFFIIVSVIAKSNGEGQNFFYYLSPRIGIILMSVASFAVIAFYNIKKSFIAIALGLGALLFFDYIHNLLGVGIQKDIPMYKTFILLKYIFAILYIYMIMIVFSLQKINTNYEAIITAQRNDLLQKNVEIEAQRDEIEAQRDEVLAQKAKIELQNKEIMDSIHYAKRIQTAVLPSNSDLKDALPEFFILFKPRNIVSGDFYWFKQIDEFSIIAVADCTGHGVPGAFMSMLGISFLNEIVTKIKLNSPEKVLDRLRKKIKTTLSQTGKSGEQKDGMDMALFIINNKTLKLQYSGAYNPLYIIRKNSEDVENNPTLNILKADKQPIAVYIKEKNFTKKDYQLQKGDCIYSFSDGYQDQFGGENQQKFMTKKFKKMLLQISQKPMEEQKQILNNSFKNWKGNLDQVDDVVVMGIKI